MSDNVDKRPNAVFRDCYSRDVLEAIFAIHFPGHVEIADLTWGKGAFWREPLEKQVIHRFDKNPRYGASYADCRQCPLPDKSVDVVVFDPPHQHGISKTTTVGQQDDYGRMPKQADIHQLILETAPEIRRVSRLGAIIKLADMVEWGRFTPTHVLVIAACANTLGWPEDIVILDSGLPGRLPVRGQIRHVRHAHSYFLVYKWASRPLKSPLI